MNKIILLGGIVIGGVLLYEYANSKGGLANIFGGNNIGGGGGGSGSTPPTSNENLNTTSSNAAQDLSALSGWAVAGTLSNGIFSSPDTTGTTSISINPNTGLATLSSQSSEVFGGQAVNQVNLNPLTALAELGQAQAQAAQTNLTPSTVSALQGVYQESFTNPTVQALASAGGQYVNTTPHSVVTTLGTVASNPVSSNGGFSPYTPGNAFTPIYNTRNYSSVSSNPTIDTRAQLNAPAGTQSTFTPISSIGNFSPAYNKQGQKNF